MVDQKTIRHTLIVALLALVGLAVLAGCSAFDAERQYITTIFDHAKRTRTTVDALHTLASNPNLGDETWERNVSTEMQTLRGLIDEANQIMPPQRFESFHQSYMGVMDTLETMADTYDSALELQNNEKLRQARDLLEQARGKIDELRQRVDSLSNNE